MLSGRRVLVVEDEMLILMDIEDMLADLGCESVTAAATVDQAVFLIERETFDLAMLDMNLDGGKTNVVADALASRCVPFIFATGCDTRDVSDGHWNRPVLNKPFRLDALNEALNRLLPQ